MKRQAPDIRSEAIMRGSEPLMARPDVRFVPETYNPETREIEVSLGSGVDVERYDWSTGSWFTERLLMDPAAIQLDRINSGAPFLEDHRQYDLTAVRGVWVKGSVRVENGELVGRVKLSRSKRAEDTVTDILDGVTTSTSVGYLVHKWEVVRENGVEIRTAVEWEPIEGSVVCIPADVTGGIRNLETEEKMKEIDKIEDVAPVAEAAPVVDERAIADAAIAEYEARCAEIRDIGKKLGIDDAVVSGVVGDRSVTVTDAFKRFADLRAAADAEDRNMNRIEVTTDERDLKRNLVTDALAYRAIQSGEPNRDAMAEYGNRSLIEIVRDYIGPSARTCGARELFQRMSTSDFPNILANVANKSLLAAQAQMEDYRWFEKVFTRSDYNDFRAHSTPWLGKTSVLPSVLEGDDYTEGSMTERGESSTAVKYGRDFPFTLEMLVNDDLGAFTDVSMEISEAALRTASSLCAALLTGNQTMGDGNSLFDTVNHGNLSASGGAPDVAKLNELWKFLLEATEDGVRVGKRGRFLLFPASLQPTVEQLYAPNRQLANYTDAALVAGIPAENRIVVPSMTGTAYYMATGARNSARFGYLREDGGLVVSSYEVEKADKVVYHARMVFGCHVNRWQDFAANPGA